MRELILKDLHLHKKYLLFLGVIFPLYMGIFGSRLDRPGTFAFFGSFMYVIGALMLFTREDRFKSVAFGLSLPATRREALASRYLLCWAMMILFYVLSAVVVVAVPGSTLGAAGFRPGTILAALGLMTLYFGALMPLTIRFGPTGIIIFIVILQVLGIVAMSLRSLSGGIRAFAAAVKTALDAAQGALGPTGFGAALVVAIVLLNLASFGISLRLFERKDY
jgi:hypothetical protein